MTWFPIFTFFITFFLSHVRLFFPLSKLFPASCFRINCYVVAYIKTGTANIKINKKHKIEWHHYEVANHRMMKGMQVEFSQSDATKRFSYFIFQLQKNSYDAIKAQVYLFVLSSLDVSYLLQDNETGQCLTCHAFENITTLARKYF